MMAYYFASIASSVLTLFRYIIMG